MDLDAADGAIGLLGGSFDPIHNGHLQLGRDALAYLPLAQVRFLPAAQPWQKKPMTASAEHRAQMVRLAIPADSRNVLDMREIERGGLSYSIDTVRELRAQWPDRGLVLLMGADQFARFDTWRDWSEIADTAHIAVAQRFGTKPKLSSALQARLDARRGKPSSLTARRGGSIVEFEMTPVDASATEVRRFLREPHSAVNKQRLAAMVPALVLDYIQKHSLYRD
ncbi:MAG: nicotinate (nicotinamide) nucleotide adenylyltransferase [Burkholderiaceae bacterium]